MKRKNFFRFAAFFLLLMSSCFNSTIFASNPLNNMLPPEAHVLFIQIANAGVITPMQQAPNTYNLVLKKVDRFTSFFTDRPNRATGILPTNQFVGIWKGQGDIRKTPPNVAMETTDGKGNRINRVFELSNPVYDPSKHEISYTAKMLNPASGPLNTTNIGYTVLFIDDFNWNGNRFG